MSVFGSIITESKVQVNDSFRIDATKFFAGKDSVTGIENVQIRPLASGSFINVYSSNTPKNWFLDWAYTADATNVVTVRITADSVDTDFTVNVVSITEADDNLPLSDYDLTLKESEITKFLVAGKTSFKNRIRRSRDQILDFMDRTGRWDTDGNKLTAASFVDTQEVKEWCLYMTLRDIYKDRSNSPEDEFADKSTHYHDMMVIVRKRARVLFDFDNDGTQEDGEKTNLSTIRAVRV